MKYYWPGTTGDTANGHFRPVALSPRRRNAVSPRRVYPPPLPCGMIPCLPDTEVIIL